ncbi:MAG: type IV secretory system conjugative DNA transfer family protein [Candidatus Omnitrophica bacterium]|nr:type IV secretory system conjugative DNA transfer family protein [Candidatus Omnitrophota bacterium]
MITLLIIGIIYLRYQEYILDVWSDPLRMIWLGCVGVALYVVYYFLRHVIEKVQNKITMYRAGIKISNKEKGETFPFLSFDMESVLQQHFQDKSKHSDTFIGLNAQKKNKEVVCFSDEQRTQHLQVLGMTGTGKSTSVFYPLIYQDAKKRRPVIIIDAKGEMSAIYKINGILSLVERSDDFLLFSLSHKEKSCSYNPLYVGDYDPQIVIDAFFSNYNDQNTFFREMSKTLFTHAFYILHSLGKPFSPMDVYCYLNNEECRHEINTQIQRKNKSGYLHLKLMNQVISDLKDQYRGWRHVVAGFNNFLMSFDDPLLNDDDSDIVLSDAIKDGKIVYFQLPTNAYPLQAISIARMVQSNLRYISSMLQTGQLKSNALVSVLIDEYGSFAEQSFVEVLNKARSSRMMVTIAHQSLGDLQNISSTFMKLIDENTLNKIYLKQTDPELAELIARNMGTYTKEEKTYRMTAGAWGNQMHSGESSNKTVQEFYFSPDKIKSLHKYGQGYFIYRGDNTQTCVNFGQFQDIEVSYEKRCKKSKTEGLKLFEQYYLSDKEVEELKVATADTKRGLIDFDE